MGIFELAVPSLPGSRNRSALGGIMLLLPLALSACSNTRDVYASGPWGPPRPRDAAATLYTSPWYTSQYRPVDAPYPAPPSDYAPTPRASAEPMEPIGPWAKRSASLPPRDDAVSSDYAHLPPAQAPLTGQQETTSPAPRAPEAKPAGSASVPRPQERRLTSLTGNWTAQTSGGAPCRLHLSSVAALDLYKASTAQCSNKALQNVNAWSLRNGEVTLYSQGSLVLRARGEGDALHGALEGTSIMVKLSR